VVSHNLRLDLLAFVTHDASPALSTREGSCAGGSELQRATYVCTPRVCFHRSADIVVQAGSPIRTPKRRVLLPLLSASSRELLQNSSRRYGEAACTLPPCSMPGDGSCRRWVNVLERHRVQQLHISNVPKRCDAGATKVRATTRKFNAQEAMR